ncbi:MAG TPA: hypothetical protein VIN58_08990 [Roseateles sp.]
MWEQDWQRLGLEPTTDLAAIKKAYAQRLKVTRPDDDAEAYQALRATYERVQQWVKWRQQEAAEEVAEAVPSEPVAATAPPPVEPQAPVEPEPPVETLVRPDQLITELTLRWQQSGEPALLHAWATETRPELDQQPLSRQVEFSAAFAQWVLATPALPDDFLKALNAHFGWLDDFRTERQLGAPLAHALHDALDARLRPSPLPDVVRELAEPLQALAALRDAKGAWWRLPWLFFLLQPLLARYRDVLGADWLQRLGLPREWLAKGIRRGLWTRIAAVTLLCWGAALLIHGDAIIAGGHAIGWMFGTGAYLIAALLAGALISGGVSFRTSTRRWALPLDRWRRHRSQPWLGLTLLLAATGLLHLEVVLDAGTLPEEAYDYGALGLALVGTVLAWPLDMPRGCVVAALTPLAGYFALALLHGSLPPTACVLVGLIWLLVGTAVHEDRLGLPESAPVRWMVRPLLNTLALVDRWTYATALAPLAFAIAWPVLVDDKARPTSTFLAWVLSILAVGWLQARADAWGLKQLRAALSR